MKSFARHDVLESFLSLIVISLFSVTLLCLMMFVIILEIIVLV